MRKKSHFGRAELVIGIVLVILGIFTYFSPLSMLAWVVRIYGLIAIITGISDIVFYVKATQYTGFGPMISLIAGIISTMAGFMLVIYPGSGTWILVLILPVWIIAHSISRLCHIEEIKMTSGKFNYYFSLILNIAGIVLGVIMIFSPSFSYLVAGFVIGTCFIVMGAELITNGIGDIKAGY